MSDKPFDWPWTGREDVADVARALRWHQVVRPRGTDAASVALPGVACNAGIARSRGRIGAAQGPMAIRRGGGRGRAVGRQPRDRPGRRARVAELNPRFDRDGRTARIAARFVAHIACAARR